MGSRHCTRACTAIGDPARRPGIPCDEGDDDYVVVSIGVAICDIYDYEDDVDEYGIARTVVMLMVLLIVVIISK